MTTILKVKDLRKEFGGLVAVDNVSFEIQSGEFVGLIGPNGCGKSTTFNCISGLLEKTSGEIEIFGQDITDRQQIRYKKWALIENSSIKSFGEE